MQYPRYRRFERQKIEHQESYTPPVPVLAVPETKFGDDGINTIVFVPQPATDVAGKYSFEAHKINHLIDNGVILQPVNIPSDGLSDLDLAEHVSSVLTGNYVDDQSSSDGQSSQSVGQQSNQNSNSQNQ